VTAKHPHISRKSVIMGGVAGNIMEWYDFAVYGYFAPVIAPQFFPSDSASASLIAAFGAFAAGFLMRPLGGMVFGHIGDKIGRKPALTLSVLMMAVPSVLIGLLPGYDSLGVMAGVLLVLLRIVQGLSVGGEYTTSIVFLVEHAHHSRRGIMGSFSGFGAVGGALLGSAVGALVNSFLPHEAVVAWGWRAAFIFGLVVGASALLLRKNIPDLESAEDPDEEEAVSPVVLALKTEWKAILRITGLLMVYAVGYYLIFLYLTTFLIDIVKIPASEALDINTAAMILMMLLIPVMAHLSDKFGRKPLLLFASVGTLVLSYPLIWLMHHPNELYIIVGQFSFSVLMAAFAGANPAAMAESFPANVRCSAMSVSFNLSFAIFGGTAPMIASYLIEKSHDDLSIAFYLMAAGGLSALALIGLEDRAHKKHLPQTGEA
jgi:MHS family proline/betaine transporter-like MFS transporter